MGNDPPPPAPPAGRGPPVGGRLALFAAAWRDLIQDEWVVEVTTTGLQLSFTSQPPLRREPFWTQVPGDTNKATALRTEVQALFDKNATELVSDVTSQGFYSRLFVVPKPGGKWRPVIDLSSLNAFIDPPKFRMETAAAVRNSVRPGEYAISLDLSDAYLHVPIAPSSRKFLRFAFEDHIFQFKSLPFGLNLSPWVFTRIMDAVMSFARRSASCQLSNYLDDLMVKGMLRDKLEADRDSLLTLLQSLGFLVNEQKSDLVPAQQFVHLGMFFQTDLNKVSLTEKRITKIVAGVSRFLELPSPPASLWLHVLGLMSAAADLLPLGRLQARTTQLFFLARWSSTWGDLDTLVTPSQEVKDSLLRWKDTSWLSSGVPLQRQQPALTLVTDASRVGWGAHILPSFEEVRGDWSEEDTNHQINWLELKAVLLVIRHWQQRLQGKTVLVLTDNTAAEAYLNKQGGTRSPQLCELAVELFMFAQSRQIDIRARHIPGRLNVVADTLSRKTQIIHTEWSLCQPAFETICQRWGKPHVDLFATRYNKKLPTFVSPVPDPEAFAVDALSTDWRGMYAYAFPPTVLVPKVLQKLKDTEAIILLVAPLNWSKSWINMLLDLATDEPLPLSHFRKLLKQPRSQVFHNFQERLNLHAWRLSSKPSATEASAVRQWRLLQQHADPRL